MTLNEKTALVSSNNDSSLPATRSLEWKYYMIVPVVTLAFFGIGLEFYTGTQWIQHYVKEEMFHNTVNKSAGEGCKAKNHTDPDYIAYEKVQSISADWQLYKNVAACIPSFFLSMLLPSYSDSYGRRFLFIVGMTGLTLQMAAESAAIYFKLDLHYFIAGSAISGLFGSFYSIVSASYSYIADISSGGRRTLAISSFDGLMLGCITVSGLACGYIITYEGFLVPVVSGGIMSFVALILTLFLLPETHKKKNRSRKVNICETLKRTFDFYQSSVFKGRRFAYLLLILAYFFEEITSTHRSSMEMIFQLGMPLCWSAEKVGIFTSIRHATEAIAGIALIVPLKACFSELSIAIWSTVFNTGSFVMEGIVQTDLTMYLVSIPATLSFLTVPMIKSIMSMMTPADKQGSLFASVVTVQSVCGIVANFLLNPIYSATVSFMNGFVFLVLAGIGLSAFVLLSLFGLTQKAVYHAKTMQKNGEVQV